LVDIPKRMSNKMYSKINPIAITTGTAGVVRVVTATNNRGITT
jgi:hypothetical protein